MSSRPRHRVQRCADPFRPDHTLTGNETAVVSARVGAAERNGSEALCDVEVAGAELLSGGCDDEELLGDGQIVEITEREAEEECEPMRMAPDPRARHTQGPTNGKEPNVSGNGASSSCCGAAFLARGGLERSSCVLCPCLCASCLSACVRVCASSVGTRTQTRCT